jgi:hypothetical protein
MSTNQSQAEPPAGRSKHSVWPGPRSSPAARDRQRGCLVQLDRHWQCDASGNYSEYAQPGLHRRYASHGQNTMSNSGDMVFPDGTQCEMTALSGDPPGSSTATITVGVNV